MPALIYSSLNDIWYHHSSRKPGGKNREMKTNLKEGYHEKDIGVRKRPEEESSEQDTKRAKHNRSV